MPERTPYQGLYDRLYLNPTLLLGLGRWGSDACGQFLQDLSSAFRLRNRATNPAHREDRLQDLIAKVSLVRDMDRQRAAVNWADEVVGWPSPLDELDEHVFTDIDGDLSTCCFLRSPRRAFVEVWGSHRLTIVQRLKDSFAAVMAVDWQERCRVLGVCPSSNLDYGRPWVVAVGSAYEPEVPLLLRELKPLILNEVLECEENGCYFLYVVDHGLPDNPEKPGTEWANGPYSLVAQMLASRGELHADPSSVVFHLTSTSGPGFFIHEAARKSVAAGILKSYLQTTILKHRTHAAPEWDSLTLSGTNRPAVSDRSAAYAEVELNLENLPRLVAEELLARWKKRVRLPTSQVVDCQELVERYRCWVAKADAGEPTEFAREVIQPWVTESVHSDQKRHLGEFDSFLDEQRLRLAEEMQRARTNVPEPPSAPKPGIFKRLLGRLFGGGSGSRRGEAPGASPSAVEAGERKVRTERLQDLFRVCRKVLEEVDRPDSAFQDRRDDDHFDESSPHYCSLSLSYRRLPLFHDCPVFIRIVLEELDMSVPEAMLSAMLSGTPAAEITGTLQAKLENLWEVRRAALGGSESAWEKLGMAEWLRSDPQLPKAMARFAYPKFAPYWRPHALRGSQWDGVLTVFEYGVHSGRPEASTVEALQKLRISWEEQHRQAPIHLFGTCARSSAEAFDPANVLWESWPRHRGIGLLWVDFPMSGNGFFDDWNREQLLEKARRWLRTNPDEGQMLTMDDQASLQTLIDS
jgi:hypothetical protein